MAKSKYKFNPETLSYDKVDNSLRAFIVRLIPHAVSVVFVSLLLFFFVIEDVFDTPEEKQLRRDNAQYINQLKMIRSEVDQLEKVIVELAERDDNLYRSIFNEEPISSNLRNPGIGGSNRYAHLENLSQSDLMIEVAKKIDVLEKRVVVQSKSYDRLVELAKSREDMLNSIPAIQPVSSEDLTRIASFFGYRLHPILGYKRMHSGIDLSAVRGTNVYVTGDGKVIEAGWSKGGYGRKIIIDHGFGYKTVYAHLHRIHVKKGQTVKRGEIIGQVGSTGLSVAPHLHYEVRLNNQPIDPINFFFNDMTPEEYDQLLLQAERTK